MAAFRVPFKTLSAVYGNILSGGTGMFCAFFLASACYLKETQQYALFYREQQQLFLFDWTYISGTLCRPGGFSALAAGFLVQFFYSLWSGAIVTSFLLTLLSVLMWLVVRRTGNVRCLLPVCFLPALFLAVSLLDNCYRYEGVTAYFLMLVSLSVYGAPALDRDKRLRVSAGCLLTVVLFYAAGAVALLFAVCALLYDCLKGRENALLSFTSVILALVAGFVAVRAGEAGLYACVYTPLGYYETGVAMPPVHYAGWLASPACLLVAGAVRLFGKRNRLRRIAVALTVSAAGFVCFLKSCRDHRNPDLENFYQYEYYTVNGKWDELLEACAIHIGNQNDANYLNLALAQKGELADRLFRYPQFGPKSLIYLSEDKTQDVRSAHVLFAMGNMAAARKTAFNACLPHSGYNPAMLKMILQIDLMRGAYAVALKYIGMLEKNLHYSGWATAQRKFLYDNRAVEQDAVLGNGRKDFPDEDAFVLSDSPMDDLYRILDANPADGKAMQYALSYLLLAKDFNHVKEFVDEYYGTPGLRRLSVPAQEALIFYYDYYHTMDKDYAVRHGITEEQLLRHQGIGIDYCREHGVERQTVERFEAFKRLYGQGRRTADAMAAYKETFWYYLLFARI